jgi:hypothetical protein
MPPGSHDQAKDPHTSRLTNLAIGRHLDPSSVSHAGAPCGKEATEVLEGTRKLSAIEGRRYHEDTNADRWEVRGITSH